MSIKKVRIGSAAIIIINISNNLSRKFNIVEQAGDGTIRIQAAITSVFTSYDDLKGYQYIPIAAAVTGAARASGVEKQSVRVMSEIAGK